MKIGQFDTKEYSVPVAGRVIRLLGPRDPWTIFNDPQESRKNRTVGYAPYWTTPWPGAVMLSEYVIRQFEPGERPVLEIGAGLGLAGIALAANGFRVVVTDFDEDALAFARANVELNGIAFEACHRLDWRSPPSEQFAMIVGSDVCYDKANHSAIIAMLTRCLADGGTALFSDQFWTDANEFSVLAAAAGFSFESVNVSGRPIPRPDAKDGRVLRGQIFVLGR
ncbi:MAG: methyltransferase domain-containing protein [Planctomycetes bacterium]|nr:methyltransferase domain-containing protein [Planctomycetota bacterium]